MASAPQLLKEIFLTLDGDDYSMDVIDAEVVPTPGDVLSVRTLDGVNHQDIAGESWALRLNCVIDWDSVRPGLAWFLFDQKGTTVAFVLGDTEGAISTTKPRIGGNVRLVPLPYGGDGNAYAQAEVLLPIDGDPVPDITP